MRYILFRFKRFCGFATGFVFYISGILKLMDPVGAGLVMKEYLNFLHIGFLEPISTVAAGVFAFAEAILGAALVTGIWRKAIAPAAVGLQTFFTILTALLVIFKPEMDCGCFGEAINLTHLETLIKNLVLLALLLIYYIPAKHLGLAKKRKYVAFSIVCLSTVAFATYSFLYIPMIDFTDYKPGTQINRLAETDDAFEAEFIYSKDGHEEAFTLENLPDTTWTFVRTETKEKKQNKETATVSIYDAEGNYADSLLATGKIIVVILYRPVAGEKEIRRLNAFLDNVSKAGFTAMVLSTSEIAGVQAASYVCDYKTLITLNRSNGGAVYLNDGFIIRKWAKKTLPDLPELAMLSDEDPTDTFIGRDTKVSLAFQGFLLYVFAVMLLL